MSRFGWGFFSFGFVDVSGRSVKGAFDGFARATANCGSAQVPGRGTCNDLAWIAWTRTQTKARKSVGAKVLWIFLALRISMAQH